MAVAQNLDFPFCFILTGNETSQQKARNLVGR